VNKELNKMEKTASKDSIIGLIVDKAMEDLLSSQPLLFDEELKQIITKRLPCGGARVFIEGTNSGRLTLQLTALSSDSFCSPFLDIKDIQSRLQGEVRGYDKTSKVTITTVKTESGKVQALNVPLNLSEVSMGGRDRLIVMKVAKKVDESSISGYKVNLLSLAEELNEGYYAGNDYKETCLEYVKNLSEALGIGVAVSITWMNGNPFLPYVTISHYSEMMDKKLKIIKRGYKGEIEQHLSSKYEAMLLLNLTDLRDKSEEWNVGEYKQSTKDMEDFIIEGEVIK